MCPKICKNVDSLFLATEKVIFNEEDVAMKKSLIFAISLVLFLTVYLCFITVEVSEAQVAMNPQGDLLGENMGDNIAFNWADEDGAVQYIVYKSLSITGPWQELGRTADVGIGGAKVDVTPDARLKDLCYKIEAIDAKGNVIRKYEPMCVPKFAGK